MKTWICHLRSAALALTVFTLGACGGGADSGGTGMGSLRVALTDAPACGYDHVYVTVEKVRVHQSSTADPADAGWADIALAPAQRIDLLGLTNGVLAELGQTPLPAGRYTQMRLVLASNNGTGAPANAVRITGDTQDTPLVTPSGQQSGLKLNINLDITANRMADLVLDFDACKSIVAAGQSGRYLLKPVISVVPRYVSGVLGHVAPSVVGPFTTVSLQQGGVVVKSASPDITGRFLLQPVAPGTYDLVLTAPGRATLLIASVPIAAETVLNLNTAVTALTPSSSASSAIGGTVAVTPAGAPADAAIRALQTVPVGAANVTFEVGSTLANETTGVYALTLPTAEPQVLSYATPLPAPTAASGVAGRYTVQASLNGSVKSAGPVSLTASAPVVANFSFP